MDHLPSSFRMLISPTVLLVTGLLVVGIALLYQWLLPKPIAGIPHSKDATKSIFGDIPSMLKHLKTHTEVQYWFLSHNTELNSPIVQLFINLFSRPIVVITDVREAQDILMRRTKEFDKPDIISNLFLGMAPDFHARIPTNDEFRYQRKTVQDLVTPAFLNNVAAPQLHISFMDLINLWSEKARLVEGRPFTIKQDIYETALEAAWAAIFGIEGTATVTRNQTALLSSLETLPLSTSIDEAAQLPRAAAPPAFRAIIELADSIENIVKSPFPRATALWQRYSPAGRRNLAVKKRELANEIAKAEARLKDSEGREEKITNAVDHFLLKEKALSAKAGHAPKYDSPVMRDNLLGLLIAAHDTTSTTLLWTLKILTRHQDIQSKLRSEFRAVFAAAHAEGRVPTANEIVTCQSAYLDAFVEEVNRWSCTASVSSRTALKDAVILGHVIPKGTTLYLMGSGHSVVRPAFDIPDNLRSEQYHKAGGGKVGTWDPNGIELFRPERWLVHDKQTNTEVYDAFAGPHLAFGGGLRGCFGKKLAYMELKLAIILMVWNFEFLDLPDAYSSFQAVDGLTSSPLQCYIKVAKL
ncbi:cytochrome P450 [Phaeosphaeria sp. MPI-PUGE-AT-0046c]|nr:cytochrome P450 [Phaeosphaeria sp. MPI-PUGE-AT-0046c]